MRRSGGLIAACMGLATLGLLALPAAVAATTFCVPAFHAGCPDDGVNVAQASLETAMHTSGSDGEADEVRIAPGVYVDPDTFTASGTDQLTVVGAGAAATELTTSSAANAYVVNLGGRPATVKSLTIAIPAIKLTGAPGAQLRNDVYEDVDIVSRAANARGIPSVIGDGSAFRGGTIYSESGGSLQAGIDVAGNVAPGQTFTIEDATITGAASGVALQGGNPLGTVDIRRTRITLGSGAGVVVAAGTANVENTQIIGAGTPLAAIVQSGSSISATLNANHVSMRMSGGGNVAVANANVQSAGTGDATVEVTNSASSGYSSKYVRNGQGVGSANVSFSYSNVPTADGSSVGPGTATIGAGNIDADPLFADPATNLALLAGSPSIDAADPAGTTSEDIDRNPRPQDGNGDSVAVSDQGAYELPEVPDTAPPTTSIETGPADGATIATGQPTFTFSSNEPGSFQCMLDGGPFTGCVSPHQLSDLADGPHTFTVKAVDNALNEDPSPPSRSFIVDTTPPETTITSGPGRRAKRTGRTRFTFRSSEPGSTFRCRLNKAPFRPCTSPFKQRLKRNGRHRFLVRAIDAVGNADPTPARRVFRVRRAR